MDLEPPTRHPCTCKELHNGKNVSGTLVGTLHTSIAQTLHPPPEFRYFAWDSCPQHGSYLAAPCTCKLLEQLGPFKGTDPVMKSCAGAWRTWMWAREDDGYRRGSEPPWEPVYYFPESDEELYFNPITDTGKPPRVPARKASRVPARTGSVFGIERTDAHLHP